jgi:sarcosine oxidase delta subunit
MKRRFILYRRRLGGMFYVEDTQTKKQEGLGTKIRAEPAALLKARNESARQPQLNLQIAKAYLTGTDSEISTRTWQDVFNAIIDDKTGSTQERWQHGSCQKAFGLIHRLVIVETQAEQLFTCLKSLNTTALEERCGFTRACHGRINVWPTVSHPSLSRKRARR